MFGHVHSDIYKQVGSIADEKDPIGVLQVCGAITTWLGNNPAYCVYELDKETMLPVSRKTYYFDIDEANEIGSPDWHLLTDWTQDFEMDDLSPASFKKMTERLSSDEAYTIDFKDRQYRLPGRYSDCDQECRTKTVCENTYMDPYAMAECNGDPVYNWQGDMLGTIRQSMLEPWVKVTNQEKSQDSEDLLIDQ